MDSRSVVNNRRGRLIDLSSSYTRLPLSRPGKPKNQNGSTTTSVEKPSSPSADTRFVVISRPVPAGRTSTIDYRHRSFRTNPDGQQPRVVDRPRSCSVLSRNSSRVVVVSVDDGNRRPERETRLAGRS